MMMTSEPQELEIVAWFEARGFPAKVHNGPVRGVMAGDQIVDTGDLRIITGTLFLHSDDRQPGHWVVDLLYAPGPSWTSYPSAREACEAARRVIEERRRERSRRGQ